MAAPIAAPTKGTTSSNSRIPIETTTPATTKTKANATDSATNETA